MSARPLPPDFRAYVWSPSSAEVAARHGLRAGADPPLRPEHAAGAGRPAGPLSESFARLNEYPDRDLPRAAGGGGGLLRRRSRPHRDRRRRGRPDRDLREDVRRPGTARRDHPTHVSALPDHEPARGRRGRDRSRGRGGHLGLQSEQPDRGAPRARRDRCARGRRTPVPPSSSTRRTSSTRTRPACR